MRNLADKVNDPQLLAEAQIRIAYAYAVDGQYDICMCELEDAKKSLSMSPHSPESPMHYFHEGHALRATSQCLGQLGHPRAAAACAHEGLALFDKSLTDDRAYAELRLSNAHLQCVEVEEAARVLGDAAALAAVNRSTRLKKEVHTTRSLMKPWEPVDAIKALDDKLTSYSLV